MLCQAVKRFCRNVLTAAERIFDLSDGWEFLRQLGQIILNQQATIDLL